MISIQDSLNIGYELEVTALRAVQMIGPNDYSLPQRNNLSPYGSLHEIILKLIAMDVTKEKDLYNFYEQMSGGWQSFAMYDCDKDGGANKWWTQVYLGTFDGTGNGIVPLKGKSTSNIVITINGTANNNWTKQSGVAVDGQDQVTFSPVPTGFGMASFNGIRYFPNCLFMDKGLSRKLFRWNLYQTGVTIRQVKV